MLESGIDQFTVKQEKGKNSTVDVTEFVQIGYPNDTKMLEFLTDQSLLSDSDRAFQVVKAIREYASQRGYEMPRTITGKKQVSARYSPSYHSRVILAGLEDQIQESPEFVEASEEAKSAMDEANREYGDAINQIKRLASSLDKALNNRLKEIAADLVQVQKETANRLNIPKELNDTHKSWLLNPSRSLTKIESNYHHKSTDKIPDDLDAILALLY